MSLAISRPAPIATRYRVIVDPAWPPARGALTLGHRRGRRTARTHHDRNILSRTHLLLILVVALIVLGPKRLPEAGRGLGSAIRGFKDSLSTPERRSEQSAIQSSRKPEQMLGA